MQKDNRLAPEYEYIMRCLSCWLAVSNFRFYDVFGDAVKSGVSFLRDLLTATTGGGIDVYIYIYIDDMIFFFSRNIYFRQGLWSSSSSSLPRTRQYAVTTGPPLRVLFRYFSHTTLLRAKRACRASVSSFVLLSSVCSAAAGDVLARLAHAFPQDLLFPFVYVLYHFPPASGKKLLKKKIRIYASVRGKEKKKKKGANIPPPSPRERKVIKTTPRTFAGVYYFV